MFSLVSFSIFCGVLRPLLWPWGWLLGFSCPYFRPPRPNFGGLAAPLYLYLSICFFRGLLIHNLSSCFIYFALLPVLLPFYLGALYILVDQVYRTFVAMNYLYVSTFFMSYLIYEWLFPALLADLINLINFLITIYTLIFLNFPFINFLISYSIFRFSGCL